MKNKVKEIFDFATFVTRLKSEKRFKTVKNFKGDDVASHSWRLAVLVFLIADELNLKINVLKAVKLALIHDFPEAVTGDIDAHLLRGNKKLRVDKIKKEKIAISEMTGILSKLQGDEIKNLWEEYSSCKTEEARYVYALDKIEGVYTFIEIDSFDHYRDYDLIATYSLRGYKSFPEIKPIIDFIQNKIKNNFENNGIEWKSKYDMEKNEI